MDSRIMDFLKKKDIERQPRLNPNLEKLRILHARSSGPVHNVTMSPANFCKFLREVRPDDVAGMSNERILELYAPPEDDEDSDPPTVNAS